MSCLTRKLRQHLACYLIEHKGDYAGKSCQWVKQDLVDRGICPTYVTLDQLDVLMEQAHVFKPVKKRFLGIFALN